MGRRLPTDFLFASPSWASGAARLLDWYGQFDEYNQSGSGQDADARAIFSDWRIAGEDLRSALDEEAESRKEISAGQMELELTQ
jgi:hypothetical protein